MDANTAAAAAPLADAPVPVEALVPVDAEPELSQAEEEGPRDADWNATVLDHGRLTRRGEERWSTCTLYCVNAEGSALSRRHYRLEMETGEVVRMAPRYYGFGHNADNYEYSGDGVNTRFWQYIRGGGALFATLVDENKRGVKLACDCPRMTCDESHHRADDKGCLMYIIPRGLLNGQVVHLGNNRGKNNMFAAHMLHCCEYFQRMHSLMLMSDAKKAARSGLPCVYPTHADANAKRIRTDV